VGVFEKPEHRAVAAALKAMDHDKLAACKCWFGGGTEIVLELGEYRLSKDIDFLCADADGYREIRSLAASGGAASLFGGGVREERTFKTDQYGVRGIISVDGITLRFEVVREARINLAGRSDPILGVPRLTDADRIAEKLLANADRCQDRSTACRDAADLGMLALHRGPFAEAALAKAEHAYGDDVVRKLVWVLDHLSVAGELSRAAESLGMDLALLEAAARALAGEVRLLRPQAFSPDFVQLPTYSPRTHMADASLDGTQVAIRRRPAVGTIAGTLDNRMGPAMVSQGSEHYVLDGVPCADREEWQRAVAGRATQPRAT
jgi:hypothetical protein